MEKISGKTPDVPVRSNISQEASTPDPNVLELQALVDSSDFQLHFLAAQTGKERTKRKKLLEKSKRAKNPARFAEVFPQANETLGKAITIQIQNLDSLKEELKKPNPLLVEALNMWGRSRNAKGESGPEQEGFNAGVIHYFEYRSDSEKNKKRFKLEHDLSVEGFIQHAKRYKHFLENPSPNFNPDIDIARLFEGSEGNRRLYILTKEKEFIVGFQRAHEEMKILSVRLEQNAETINRTVEEALHPTAITEGRFNRLESPIKEIPLDKIEQESFYQLKKTEEYLNFKNIKIEKTEKTKKERFAGKVKVTKNTGEIIEIDARTPFFRLMGKDGKELTVSADTVAHVDSLHIKGTEPGSLFDYPSFEAVIEDVAKRIPSDIATEEGVSAFDIDMGKIVGKEGIATLEELQELGELTKEDVEKASALKDEVEALNRGGAKQQKEIFIQNHSDGKVHFQLVRNDVLIPIVNASKKPTTKIFMIFVPIEGGDQKTMYTMAPGRSMPMHPDPIEYTHDGVIDDKAFKESADEWFNTVMLIGE